MRSSPSTRKAAGLSGRPGSTGTTEEKSEVEIGWTFLSMSHWGGLYNGEMKRLMIGHAFRSVENVSLLIGTENVRSQQAVE